MTRPGAALVPPRPNPGPLPWPSTGPSAWWWAVPAVALVALAGLGILARRRRRDRPGARPIAGLTPPESPICWAEAVRAVLVARHGPAWSAKTSEEIAVAAEVVTQLGPARADELGRLLAEADYLKFAGGSAGVEPEASAASGAASRVEILEALTADQRGGGAGPAGR